MPGCPIRQGKVVYNTTFEAIPMKTISAANANRQFSQVLQKATRGQTILITSRGKAVAAISPATGRSPVQAAAKLSLLARLSKQKVSGKRAWTRAELYEPKNVRDAK